MMTLLPSARWCTRHSTIVTANGRRPAGRAGLVAVPRRPLIEVRGQLQRSTHARTAATQDAELTAASRPSGCASPPASVASTAAR